MALKKPSWEIENNKQYPKLTGNVETDVVIVGAGIAGIFSAYVLSRAGFNVVVLEKEQQILQSTTLYTTAFITKLIDTTFRELVSTLGQEKAKLIWQSGQDAINLIADIVKREPIDCDFGFTSIYTYASNEKQYQELTGEYDAIKKAGFEASLQKDGSHLNFKNAGFLEIPNQAKFHPIKFAMALANLAESAGVKIFTDSEVLSLDGTTVKTKEGQVTAKDVVITTYTPLTHAKTRFRKAMYVSYVYELEIPKELIPEGLYIDMHSPYHYFRIDGYPNFDRMIVGGEDHRKDVPINPDKNFKALKHYVKSVLGDNAYTVVRAWQGNMLESVDGLALIGAIKPHTYVATAFSGNGMTYSAIAATILKDVISGKKNLYSDVYKIKRVPTVTQFIGRGLYYSREFLGGAFKNFFIKN